MLQVRQSNGSKARKLVAITLTVVSRPPLYLVFSVSLQQEISQAQCLKQMTPQ